MNEPRTTLLPEVLEERAAIAFLERFVADVATGRTCALGDYLAAFPRFEARIAREWLQLRGLLPAASPAVADGGTAAGDAATVGPYRLVSELGRGAQGVVYLADDPRLGRRVALKVLLQDVRSLSGASLLRLQREAAAIARLEHEGIARVYEHGRDDRTAWIAMQYVPGGSVQELLRRRAGPPRDGPAIAAVVLLVERAARALAAAHAAGILHRDIKPANLLLKGDDEPVLVDFGLATDERAATPTITAPGAVFGTLGYLAPERLAGAPADARADVYSLGAVLYELLAGRRPYEADVMAHELKALADGAAPDVRRANVAVPGDLAVVVATAIAKAPVDRYASAAAFAEDLQRVRTMRPIAARPARAFVRLRRWAQRNPGLARSLAALVLAVTAGLAATTWLWRQSDRALADVKRLADLKLARELVARADELWPARPERLAAMRAWHVEFDALHERLPAHRSRRAVLGDGGADPAVSWEREQLDLLLAEHTKLAATAVAVDVRIAAASTLVRRSLEEPAQAWRDAGARVAGNPRYRGLRLQPQLGLVPLGPDPHSGLEEFAHVLSGAVPERAADGALRETDDTGLVLVLVPGGPAVLGADREPPPDGRPANVDPDTPKEQEPSYTLELQPYFLARCEMTQAQWQRHTGANPATYRIGGGLTAIASARHPIELVTWEECDRALRQLDLCFPTEAQWEFAYRAGTRTPNPYGADAKGIVGHENLADVTARERGANRRLRFIDWLDDGWLVHAPVGSFRPNGWGFFDMGGNVKEWCADSWEDYPAAVPRTGDGLRRGKYDEYRIVRGGSFSSWTDDVRAAARMGVQKNTSGAEAGVRPARRLE
ncbi:MAG: SUMF1/EgtB/PvdO family nonheme iron enzyme [Planctomycetes bacterium]|nr:SUMF1/EgtB/PvdO family nonheme iron enzyme [Planctomycetota bacterium]